MSGPVFEHLGATRIAHEDEPESCARILFVGEDNPVSADPHYSLWPAPDRCAGERLCNVILRMDEDDYLACGRTNLCHDGPWDLKKARARAETLLRSKAWGTYVVLGAKVAKIVGKHVGIELQPFKGYETHAGYVVYLPHPSGRNLVYNQQVFRDKARDLIRCLHPDLWSE